MYYKSICLHHPIIDDRKGNDDYCLLIYSHHTAKTNMKRKNNLKTILMSTLLTASFISSAMLPVQASSSADSIDYEMLADLVSERTYLDEELNKIGLSIDEIFSLPKMDEQYYTDAAALSNETLKFSPSAYADEPTVQTLEAKRLAYAGQMAQWSMARNPQLNTQQEVVYMYLSHYVDVPQPLSSSNGISNNSEGLLAKYITKSDREAYELYLSRGNTVQAVKNIKNLISLGISAQGDIKDAAKWMKERKGRIKGLGLSGELGLDIRDARLAFGDIKESMEAGESAEATINAVIKRLQPKYDEMAVDISYGLIGIVSSIAAGNFSTMGLIITSAGIAIDLMTNIYDRLFFIGMRIDFSFRYSKRFDYYMSGNY